MNPTHASAEPQDVPSRGPRRIVLQLPAVFIVVRESDLRSARDESILRDDRRNRIVAVLLHAVSLILKRRLVHHCRTDDGRLSHLKRLERV